MGALSGKRVLVTRTREQAQGTVALLRDRGAEAVVVPTIEIHPPRDPEAVRRALARVGEYPWVVLTSENGVSRAWMAMEEARLTSKIFEGRRVAAVGPGTAQALEERGVRVDVVAKEMRGEGLAKAMLEAMKPGDRVLLLRAEVAREVLPETLRAAGHEVDVVAVYETRKPAPEVANGLAGELARGAIDAVTLTSASTVENLCDLLGDRAGELLAKTALASIGPVTSAALARRGLTPAVEAPSATLPALVEALSHYFVKGRA